MQWCADSHEGEPLTLQSALGHVWSSWPEDGNPGLSGILLRGLTADEARQFQPFLDPLTNPRTLSYADIFFPNPFNS